MLYIYIILTFILIILISVSYIKIKFPFWNIQPVFHYYNILYWFKPPGIIYPELPCANKYVNLININTRNIDNINNSELQKISNFIKNYYLKNKNIHYSPEPKHIFEYLKSNNHPSYVSVYNNNELLFENDTISNKKECIGVFSTRSLNVKLKDRNFTTYYADNLCVHPGHRKKGIAPELIQTHYYNIRRLNSKINNCLFKREGELTAIVPLITYYTYGFKLNNININTIEPSISHIEITNNNLQLLTEFIKKETNNYDCVIIPDISNIINLIKTENIFIYALIQNHNLIACYIFRDPSINYDNNKAIESTCSIFNNKYSKDVFINGFKQSYIKCREKIDGKCLLIEDIGNNNIIINNLLEKNIISFIKSPTAFFLYNYATYSCNNNKSFLLY